MMNYETAHDGPKAPLRPHSSSEHASSLDGGTPLEIRRAAKRRRHYLESPDYNVDHDLDDLIEVGGQYRKLQIKTFDYLVNTPIRAEANGEFGALLARLTKNVGMDKREDRTIYHLLARGYLGFTHPATISMWARAAMYAVAHLRADETVPAFLKRMGGIRACADAARKEVLNEDDSNEDDCSDKPKLKLSPKARAKMRREVAEDHCQDRRVSRSMPAGSGASRRKSGVVSAANFLDKEYFEDDDDELPPLVDFSEDAREAFEAGSDDEEGVAHVIRRGDVIEVKCIVWTENVEEIIDQAR